LMRVATLAEEEALRALEEAVRARLLEEAGRDGYRFTHDVIREAIEAGLGAARRRILHRQIARALEAAPGEPPAAALAYHSARTPGHAKAARWLERAGDDAGASFAHTAAQEHFTAAQEQLRACGAESLALARLDEKLGDLRLLVGEYARAQEHFARARA